MKKNLGERIDLTSMHFKLFCPMLNCTIQVERNYYCTIQVQRNIAIYEEAWQCKNEVSKFKEKFN